jgi:hypothetical protein
VACVPRACPCVPCAQHQLTDGPAPRLADKARRERGGEGSSEESRSKTQVAETRSRIDRIKTTGAPATLTLTLTLALTPTPTLTLAPTLTLSPSLSLSLSLSLALSLALASP